MPEAVVARHFSPPAKPGASWMPFTPHRSFNAKPLLMVEASGMHHSDSQGRKILEAMAGLWR